MHDPRLGPGAIAAVLRGSFLALFAAQAVVAGGVAWVAVAVAGPQRAPSAWVAGVAVAASAGQLLLGLVITAAGVRSAGRAARAIADEPSTAGDERSDAEAGRPLRAARSAALSLALLAAVLLSTPAWFAAFAWATGQRPLVLGLIGVLLATGYGFGVAQLGPLAHAVALRDASDRDGDAPADG